MIPVYLRLRPHAIDGEAPAQGSDSNKSEPWLNICNGTTVSKGSEEYAFKRIFQDSTQEEVYGTCVYPLVKAFLQGKDTCFFTLGATGSGKTYTVVGTQSSAGMVSRALNDIFANGSGTVNVAMFELYNDKFYDLLDDRAGKRQLLLKSNMDGFSVDAMRIPAANTEGAMNIIYRGFNGRAVHATNCNSTSSRSHAFTLIEQAGTSLIIADLAGSERLNEAGSVGAQRIEAGEINKSLMMLGQALQQMRQGGSPLRTSKLSRVLLGNAHKCPPVMLVTLDAHNNPNTGSQILRYASTALQIKHQIPSRATATPYDRDGAQHAKRREALLRQKFYADMDRRLANLSDKLFVR